MHFEIRNHPAQARHPLTDKPVFDAEGNPVPLHPDRKSIYMDGKMIGYCGTKAGEVINMTCHAEQWLLDAVYSFVTEEIGEPKRIFRPPSPEAVEVAEREIFGEEDDDLDEEE